MTISVTYQENVYSSLLNIGGSASASGDMQVTIDETVAIGATNYSILTAIDVSKLKLLAIYSSKALTVKTNDSGSPDDTLSLLAAKPWIWVDGGYNDCPLTVDVAELFITNASGAESIFRLVALLEA